MDTTKSICELVRKAESDYTSGSTQLSKHVSFSLFDNISKIEAYIYSKHTTGETDSQNREKPFFNIVTAARNIWFRATDLDRKHLRIRGKTEQQILCLAATSLLRDWMNKAHFGVFLNEWGRTLATYGSAVVEFVEKGDELICSVLPWNRIIIDSVDFKNGPLIKILDLTEAQLRMNTEYDQEQVELLCEAFTTRKNTDGQEQDAKSDYIRLYELHQLLPLSKLTGREEDEKTFVQQMHTVSFVAKEGKKGGDAEYDDFTLVKGREKNPHMITHLIREEGRSQAIGAVEHLFEAQWMLNHSVKAIKDQLDLASKLIFQTSDANFVAQNVLSSIENGDILIHKFNEPLTQVANTSHDTTALQNFGAQWKALAQEIVSTPDVMMGKTMPSGTAWRLGGLVQQESYSNFKVMLQNKGLALEDMAREFIIPFLKKKMDTSEEITAVLEANEISQFDPQYIGSEATKRYKRKAIDALVKGQVPQGLDLGNEITQVKGELSTLGNMRPMKPSDIPTKTWKELLKDLEWTVEVEITDETTDKATVMDTLTTVLTTMANPAMQAVLQTPEGKFVFNKILEETGRVSPIELSSLKSTPTAPVALPAMAAGGTGRDGGLPVQ